jgi:hypothetical protein
MDKWINGWMDGWMGGEKARQGKGKECGGEDGVDGICCTQ